MSVNTKQVNGRRKVSYASYEQMLADVRKLAEGQTTTMGNWSLAQICKHLAAAFHGAIDGIAFRAPWPMRVIAKLVMKRTFLTKALPAGFSIPKKAQHQFLPEDAAELAVAIEALEAAVERLKKEPKRVPHPIFDQLSREEWDQFNLRHAELHMSFVKPVGESTS